MSLLEVRGLAVARGGLRVLEGLDLSLQAGRVLVLRGPNGLGKTTLLRTLAGLQPAVAGEVVAAQDGVAYAGHADGLKPALTVAENLYLGRQPRRWGMIDRRRMQARAGALLARYGIAADPDETLARYSVAVRQIIAIARAVALSGKVLILDEPTRGIDVGAKSEIHRLITQLAGQGVAVLMISSELPEVLGMSDRIMVMHEGHVSGFLDRAEADQVKIMSLAAK